MIIKIIAIVIGVLILGADLNVEPCRCKKAVDPRLAKLAQLLEDR